MSALEPRSTLVVCFKVMHIVGSAVWWMRVPLIAQRNLCEQSRLKQVPQPCVREPGRRCLSL